MRNSGKTFDLVDKTKTKNAHMQVLITALLTKAHATAFASPHNPKAMVVTSLFNAKASLRGASCILHGTGVFIGDSSSAMPLNLVSRYFTSALRGLMGVALENRGTKLSMSGPPIRGT